MHLKNVEKGYAEVYFEDKECAGYVQLEEIDVGIDYKKDELGNIYKGKGTQKEKESVYEILFSINASQNTYWEKIKE